MLTLFLEKAVAATARRPWPVLVIAALVVFASAVFAARNFDMSTDTVSLISPDTDWRRNEAEVSKAFPRVDSSVAIIVDGKTPELAEDAAIKLANALESDKANFTSVERPDGGDFFDRNGLLFASLPEVRETTQKLIDAQPLLGGLALDPSLRGIGEALATAAGGAADDPTDPAMQRLEQPLSGLHKAISAKLDGKTAYFSWQELFASGTGDLKPQLRRVVVTQPVFDFSDLQPASRAVAAIRDHAEKLGITPANGLKIGITGEAPLGDEEFGSIQENIGLVGLIMATAMLLTLWLATRSAKITAAIAITIVAGLVITLAGGLAAAGSLNVISIAFIPLFVGLGVDFGIQVSVRFNAERWAGAGLHAALERAAVGVGAPILLAAAAICLALVAFLPTDYTGLAELGIISAFGMVIALILNLTLLPALLVLMKPAAPAAEVGYAGAAPLDRWLERNRKQILWAFVIAMLVSIAMLPLVRFDFNPLNLRDIDAPAMRALRDLMSDPARTPNTLSVLAPNENAARALASRLGKLPEVRDAITLDSFIPEGQPEKLALIEDAALLLDATINPFDLTPPGDDAAAVASLGKASGELRRLAAADKGSLGRAAGQLAQDFDRLAQASPNMRGKVESMLVPPLGVTLDKLRLSLQASQISRDTLPTDMVSGWITKDGRAIVQLVPKGDSADNAVLTRFASAVRAIAPDASGVPVSTQEAARTISRAFIEAGVIALILVSLLLYAVLRSVREVAFTLAPVVLSGFLTLGSCVIIGQPLNFANIIAFPLLFGVGVAFHIYFVMAWRRGARNLLQTSLARAVLFSALATGSAFGALWISSHPGTASMGLILMISLIWTLVCALIFEPALLGPPEGEPEQGALATI